MLRVEHDAPARVLQVANGLADHREVLLKRGLQRARHLGVPRLADDGDHRRAAREQIGETLVLLDRDALATRAAEGRDARVGERHGAHGLEKRDVLRVRRGETSLDVVDAERIETPHDAQLVLERKRDPLALLAVAKRAIVGVDAILQLLRLFRVGLTPTSSLPCRQRSFAHCTLIG